MKVRNYAAGYAIFMGVSMIGMWVMFLGSGQVPELTTRPFEILMHLVAELMTAVLLIIGGSALLRHKAQGNNLFLLSMGMLIYTVIMSPGYFLQQGEYGFVLMFGTFLLSAVSLTVLIMRDKGVDC